ncbi:MAG: glutaredoxin [Bacteroidota bacterium]|nr:glutaredoxin [Bacteroidota bacterium]
MKFHPNELFILFDSSTNTGKQTRALAYSITRHVNEVNCFKTKFSSTIWKEILNRLNLRAKDLLNRAHPDYQEKIAGNSFDEEGWLNVLVQNPCLLKAPIAIKNNKAVLCVRPSQILMLS